MKNQKRNIVGFVLIILLLAACAVVAAIGVGETHQGKAANIKLGLDLAGGVSITYQADAENPAAEDMSDTVYKLQQRVAVYSNDAEVYQEGTNRINVEIPGVYDAQEVLSNLGNPGKIQFFEQVETTDTEEEAADTAAETDMWASMGFSEVINGDDVVDAQVATQKNEYGTNEYVVSLTLSGEGAVKFEEATGRNIGKPIYIVYDNNIISYPTVQSRIGGGQCIITGNFTYDSANSLATTIRLGVLKLTLSPIRSSVVGAKLGTDAVRTSLIAALIGLAIVIIFMIIMYRVPGVAAGIALVLYVLMMLLFLNAFNVTLTLPGIAGIILSIGMAVDANVIIFTRIQEEIGKGNAVSASIRQGFAKALSAIIDGNVTTLIAAAVLYILGTGAIKGFAVTLALGIILSMITALIITRILMAGLYAMGAKKASLYGSKKDRTPINFTGKKVIFYIISLVVIAAGLIGMGVSKGTSGKALNFSLDFTGGSSMNVTFNEYIDVTGQAGIDLEKKIENAAGTSDVQLQNIAGSNEIVMKMPEIDADHAAALKNMLTADYGVDASTISEENISGIISGEMRRDAVVAVIVAGICMLIYMWIRFRDIKFGASAVLALAHDVLITLTLYALVRIPVGNTFIACMLTIVGYSINATIVIFDRIRENRRIMKGESMESIVNTSITQTFSRSINTSLTTFIMVFVLFILGVSSIRDFALPLMAGIVGGAWSSICITATLWYVLGRIGKKA